MPRILMSRILKRLAVATGFVGVLLLANSAQAGLIVDTIDHGMERVFYKHYSHNLNDDSSPFVLGSAISATLEIETFKERDCNLHLCMDEWFPHIVLVVIEEFDFDTDGVTSGSFNSGLEMKALAALNADGFLKITLVSLNDFLIGVSTLTVHTSSVPEPGALSLLGAGLLGLGWMQRRRRRG